MSAPRAAVVGSGFGGLALAIRLQAAGVATTIVEKRDRPGGRAYVYEQDGFTFDAGPTVITAPDCLRELWTLAGRSFEDAVDLLPVTPFYRLAWEDGDTFDYSGDLAATRAQIARRNPADVAGYDAFLAYAEEVFEQGYTRLAHVPFLDWWSMIRVAPQLARLQAYRSVYDVVARFIRDDRLRQAFSFHSLLVGGNPFSTSAIYTLIHVLERKWGVFFPRGGTGALVRALVALFESLGGTVRLSSEVERIVVHDGKVAGLVTKDGWSGTFDVVASNADVVHTYGGLLGREERGREEAERLRRQRFSMSLFLVYFGTKRRYPGIAHHTVLFGPRYRELLRDIFEGHALPEDFSLYLHAPTVTDPGMAPAGGEAFYVLAPVPHLGQAPLDWTVEGPRYADRILAHLERHLLPDLRAQIVTRRIFTPADFAGELNSHLGSAFSLEPVLTQSAWFRVHNRDARLPGLYFVGAGTHPGAGVPGVVNSAKATAGLVLDDLRAEGRKRA
ncbi:MAG: phytoene desaturase [Vicinamibacteria bacterium]